MDDRSIHSIDDHADLREGEVYNVRGRLRWTSPSAIGPRRLMISHTDWTDTYIRTPDDAHIPFAPLASVVVKARADEDLQLVGISIHDYNGGHVLL